MQIENRMQNVACWADRVKILVYDGTGLVLIWKRLEGAKFKWPAISDGVMRLSAAQLAALFEGLDGGGCTPQGSDGRRWLAECAA